MTADRIFQPLADAAMWAWFALDRRLDRVRGWFSDLLDRIGAQLDPCPTFPDSTEDDL